MNNLNKILQEAAEKLEEGSGDFCGTPTTARKARKLAKTLSQKDQQLDCLSTDLKDILDRQKKRGCT